MSAAGLRGDAGTNGAETRRVRAPLLENGVVAEKRGRGPGISLRHLPPPATFTGPRTAGPVSPTAGPLKYRAPPGRPPGCSVQSKDVYRAQNEAVYRAQNECVNQA